MINLHAKIFIGVWLSMIAIFGSWLLAGRYFETFPEQLPDQEESPQSRTPPAGSDSRNGDQPPSTQRRRPPPGAEFGPPPKRREGGRRPPPGGVNPHDNSAGEAGPEERARGRGPTPRAIFRIFYELQNVSKARLPILIDRIETEHNFRILLIDEDGEEILGKSFVPGTQEILNRLRGFRRRTQHREGNVMLFGQEMYRPEWEALTLVIAHYPPKSRIVNALTEYLWLRLLLAVVISGLISYAVSRYLTRPLKKLQLASRQLAQGDLGVRIEVPHKGGDETDELGRDFNSMAAQLQEKIQAQRRMVHDVSHELRSPLARLRVALALAERDPQNSQSQLARIEKETERLDELIGQLLAVPETRVALEDSLDLVALLNELVTDANYEAKQDSKIIHLDTELQEAVIATHGDFLKKAFENIIRNGLHHSPEQGQVAVQLRQDQNSYVITVLDSGPGVPNSALERIFEPFFRLDESRQRETGGYGLGLSIASRAIAQHNGSISAHNTSSGLCVTITLPQSKSN